MRRRDFMAVLVGAAYSTLAGAQNAMPVIGYLGIGSPESRRLYVDAFRQGLAENGYVEGRDIAIEYRWAEDELDRFPALAAELVARNVNIIVSAGGTLAALAAKRATATIPVVFTAVGDPVQEGLAASLARPGGNITGLSFFAPQLGGKRLELLKHVLPAATLISVLLKPDSMPDDVREDRLKELEASARVLGLRLQVVEARAAEDLERAFAEIAGARATALLLIVTPLFLLERQRIAELSAKYRLPAVSESRELVDAGGLMSYGPNLPDLHRRTAGYVAKILGGATPADLPVEQPTKFEFVINMKTARVLGLAVPQSILARADEVIE